MFETFAIANRILDEAERRNIAVSPLKLQKLIYYAHGWWLGFKGEPLINETIEAWQYGPVVPSVYKEFRDCGNQPIQRRATQIEWGSDDLEVVDVPSAKSPDLDKLIDHIFNIYGNRSATELSAMTHAEKTPWSNTYKGANTPRGTDIPNSLIESYFKNLIEQAKRNRAEVQSH